MLSIKSCRQAQTALGTALSKCRSDEGHVDAATAVRKTIAQVGSAALGTVLATETVHYSYDERLSEANRDWACEYLESNGLPADYLDAALYSNYVANEHHMTVLDRAVCEYRKQIS